MDGSRGLAVILSPNSVPLLLLIEASVQVAVSQQQRMVVRLADKAGLGFQVNTRYSSD